MGYFGLLGWVLLFQIAHAISVAFTSGRSLIHGFMVCNFRHLFHDPVAEQNDVATPTRDA
jgi:hypothetical protein